MDHYNCLNSKINTTPDLKIELPCKKVQWCRVILAIFNYKFAIVSESKSQTALPSWVFSSTIFKEFDNIILLPTSVCQQSFFIPSIGKLFLPLKFTSKHQYLFSDKTENHNNHNKCQKWRDLFQIILKRMSWCYKISNIFGELLTRNVFILRLFCCWEMPLVWQSKFLSCVIYFH